MASYYDKVETSLRSRSQRLTAELVGRLIAGQLPASGGWSPIVQRLDRIWNDIRRSAAKIPDTGEHSLTLLVDEDHYACVTTARDEASDSVVLGCDIYGEAAETSVLVPMERAAARGSKVHLFYRRPSRYLIAEGRLPDPQIIDKRGMQLEKVDGLHGKFLAWDDLGVAISSFNWLSTSVRGTRARGAELGVLVRDTGVREALASKIDKASKGKIVI